MLTQLMLGEASLCCDVKLVSLLTCEGRPQPGAATRDGAASVLPTLRCCGRVRSDCASSLAKLEAVGALTRDSSSLNSCDSE